MHNFLSAIIMKNGDLLCDPEHTDSHTDLLSKYGIQDKQTQNTKFARVEFLPPKDHSKIFDTSEWFLEINKPQTPDWFNKDRVRRDLAARVQRMFVRDERDLLLGGCWILGSGASIRTVKNALIWGMYGNAWIERLYDSSQIEEMRGTSQIQCVINSQVKEMRNTSLIEGAYGTSQIEEMYNMSRIEEVSGLTQIGVMRNSSYIDELGGKSQVGTMWDSSQVKEITHSARIVKDFRKV